MHVTPVVAVGDRRLAVDPFDRCLRCWRHVVSYIGLRDAFADAFGIGAPAWAGAALFLFLRRGVAGFRSIFGRRGLAFARCTLEERHVIIGRLVAGDMTL